MPDKRNDTPSPSARQVERKAAADSVACAIGTRCEKCAAPLWPIGAACRSCARIEAAARRLRDHRAAAAVREDESIAHRPRLPISPTDARLRREAARTCTWSRDVPRPALCPCVPCLCRRVLATLESEVTR